MGIDGAMFRRVDVFKVRVWRVRETIDACGVTRRPVQDVLGNVKSE